MKLVWKLLRQNINKPQLVGFFLANLTGLTIILLAVQFYFDVNPIFTGKDKLFKDDYLTLSKEVSIVNTFENKSIEFSDQEIEKLKEQNFVKDVGVFVPSQFNVFAGINNPKFGVAFNTEMFFESIPDKFIGDLPSDWKYTVGDNTIPIIVPKNYLDLYNFGFSEASGMPKITEDLIGLVSMDISIYGLNNDRQEMKGRIVGFSNHINTILVPEGFMTWANQKYGRNNQKNPARLIVEVSNIADPNLTTYLAANKYTISGDNTSASKMSYLLKIIIAVVVAIGLVICLLSFFILVLSIYLLLEKNMTKIENLRLIGYSKTIVTKPYIYLVLGINSTILLVSLLLVFLLRSVYLKQLKHLLPMSTPPSGILYAILVGFILFLFLIIANICIIRNKIK